MTRCQCVDAGAARGRRRLALHEVQPRPAPARWARRGRSRSRPNHLAAGFRPREPRASGVEAVLPGVDLPVPLTQRRSERSLGARAGLRVTGVVVEVRRPPKMHVQAPAAS